MVDIVLVALVALLVSLYELVMESSRERFVASLCLRGALLVTAQVTKWEATLVVLLMYMSPSTILIFVRESVKAFKGFNDAKQNMAIPNSFSATRDNFNRNHMDGSAKLDQGNKGNIPRDSPSGGMGP